MADIDYDDYGASPRISGGQIQRLIHLGGAACSVALIAGVGLWGYKLAVRDATGVPVIHAAEGPMRVPPSNPGGKFADHQGMAVNEIAAVGGAGAMPAQVILAPAPMDLAAEDVPGLAPLETAALPAPPALVRAPRPMAVDPQGTDAAPLPLTSPAALVMPQAHETGPLATQDAVAMALAEALGDALPLAPFADPKPEAAPVQGVSSAGMVRPRARPAAGFAALAAGRPVSAALSVGPESVGPESGGPESGGLESGGPEIDPASLTAGTRLVQLGAFDSPEIARAEWSKLRDRFGDLMTGKSLVVQSADSGGRTFYRLRAHGFGGEDDARRFCAALLAENAACIPVAHR